MTGKVFDNLTKGALVGCRVDLLNASDSCLVSSTSATKIHISHSDTTYTSDFGINVPGDKSEYILKISDYGYKPHFVDLDKDALKQTVLNLGNIYLRHEARNLSEVTVTASKVKFYNNGDTIVYNADTFILAEGSMLDALIKQLPGVELHSDGRIYVNGKFVDNLMLNGKDFFKGKNNVLLDNLGAYTVKDIKVYDQLNNIDKHIGEAVTGQRELVMDVRLKKDYMDSWLVNVMGGYGTSDRYIGRLFVTRLTPRSHISLFANANNINEVRKPGQENLDWSPSNIESGIKNTLSGGLDYAYDFPDNIWKIKGDLVANKTDFTDATSLAQTNFTQPNFTYQYSHNNSDRHNFEVATNHSLTMEKDRFMWWLNPSFNWRKTDLTNSVTQADFTAEQQDWSSEFIRNIYSSDDNIRNLLNRKIADDESHSRRVDYNISTGTSIKIPGTFNSVVIEAGANGYSAKETIDEIYSLDFTKTPELNSAVNRHFNNTPDRSNSLTAKIAYYHIIARKMGLFFDYQLDYTDKKAGSDLYVADLADREDVVAPSYYNFSGYTLDSSNSFLYNSSNLTHTFSPSFSLRTKNVMMQASFPIIISTDRLNYQRGDFHTSLRRTALLFEQRRNTFIEYKYKASTWFATVTYTTKAPDLLDMVDITDTTNPLMIEKGNPDLKNSGIFKGSASYLFIRPANNMYLGFSFDCQLISNALAKGYNYDSASGVKIFKTYNVNGNRNFSGGNSFSFDFGPRKSFGLKHNLTGKYIRSADIIGVDDNMTTSIVNRHSITENLAISFTRNGQKIALTGNLDFARFTGDAVFNTFEFHYGIQGIFKLPYGIGINTDFTIYGRRGYQEESLNTNNYVWNARLSYSLLKGQLLLTLDGFDILHNLSNVFYTINAQGRTETYCTTLPRYFMLGVQWKFNTSSSRKAFK
ncbi:MAG: hypothetical protein K2L83_06045 [Muribaculaceae bacterium]|nr:hypothetical protein [Muribaculaceae bacterium]